MGAQNIFLVGPMGAGKTTVGRRLAEALGVDFMDTDHEIEQRTGVEVAYIFEREGEAGFRRRERQVIAELTARHPLVLATGGGAILDPENRSHLAARGFVVYLHATVEQQLERTASGDHRPLLRVSDPRAVLDDLFRVRDPLYRSIADLVLETGGRNARQLVRTILRQAQLGRTEA